jgi:hypothetical protein
MWYWATKTSNSYTLSIWYWPTNIVKPVPFMSYIQVELYALFINGKNEASLLGRFEKLTRSRTSNLQGDSQTNQSEPFFCSVFLPCTTSLTLSLSLDPGGCHGHDRMVVGFKTTYAIGAYHNWCCKFEFRSGGGVQHYVIKFVRNLRQVGGFLQVLLHQ